MPRDTMPTSQQTPLTLEEVVRKAVDSRRIALNKQSPRNNSEKMKHHLTTVQAEKDQLLLKLNSQPLDPKEIAATQASLAVVCAYLGAHLPYDAGEKFQNWLNAGKLYAALAHLCEATWYEAGIAYKATAECRFDHQGAALSESNQLKFYLQAALCFQRSIPLDRQDAYFCSRTQSTTHAFGQVDAMKLLNHQDIHQTHRMTEFYHACAPSQRFVLHHQSATTSKTKKQNTRNSTHSQKNAAKEMSDVFTGINSVALEKDIEVMFALHQELFGAAVSSNEPSTPPPPYAQSVAARAHPPTPPAALLPDPVTFSRIFASPPPYQLPAPIKKTQHNPYGHTAFVEPEESNTNTTLSPR